MEIEITEQQQKDYLKDPNRCPVCHSSNITADSTEDWSNTDAWRTIYCKDCKHQWVECFKLWKIGNLENVQSNP